MKRWPLTLIKRGVRVGTTSQHPETIWWQETNPEAPTAQAARNIGYEAYEFIPVSYAETIAGAAENLLTEMRKTGDVSEERFEELEMRVQSFRDNVEISKPE